MSRKSQDPLRRFLEALKRAEEARGHFELKRAGVEARMAEARARMEALLAFHGHRRAEIAALLARRRGGVPPLPKPFRRRRPRGDEGGEAVPAIPRPKPTPLTGGAAAPLDPDRRKPVGGIAGTRGRGKRLPSDAESRQIL